jgi:hypothetical protein
MIEDREPWIVVREPWKEWRKLPLGKNYVGLKADKNGANASLEEELE